MRKLFVLIFFLFVGNGLVAQILEPAKWSYDVSSKEVNIGDEVELIFKATIDPDWYLYSSDFDSDLGPMLTEFAFKPSESFELVEGITPINAKEKYDEIWEGKIRYFKLNAEFRQKIKILGNNPVINVSYSYQVCSDVDGKCIPFDDEFTFKGFSVSGSDGSVLDEPTQIKTQELKLPGADETTKR